MKAMKTAKAAAPPKAMKVVRRIASAKSKGRTKVTPPEHGAPEMRAEHKDLQRQNEKLWNRVIRSQAENQTLKKSTMQRDRDEITHLRLQCKEKTEDMRQETVLRGHAEGACVAMDKMLRHMQSNAAGQNNPMSPFSIPMLQGPTVVVPQEDAGAASDEADDAAEGTSPAHVLGGH